MAGVHVPVLILFGPLSLRNLHLGLPLWGHKEWAGSFYAPGAKALDFLQQYSRVFNAVEGNTTFYSVPSPEAVHRWARQTPSGFRFCFKLPRTITHERSLQGVVQETHDFFEAMEPLRDRLGPFMVQLPASFPPSRLDDLATFLFHLPKELRFVVELRHEGFFEEETARLVDDLLNETGCGRAELDTRPLRAGDAEHPEVRAAEHEKPDLPVREKVTADLPFVRLITHPEAQPNRSWLHYWAGRVARWIRAGHEPYVFVHCPNNLHSPGRARALHRLLVKEQGADVGELPPFPAEVAEAEPGAGDEQMTLFEE